MLMTKHCPVSESVARVEPNFTMRNYEFKHSSMLPSLQYNDFMVDYHRVA